jgi:hypothetical protein
MQLQIPTILRTKVRGYLCQHYVSGSTSGISCPGNRDAYVSTLKRRCIIDAIASHSNLVS